MRRRGTAMVAVMVLILVMAALGATMMTSARGTRRKTRKVAERVQRELALDAAFVHGFHVLKGMEIDPASPLQTLDPDSGQGKLVEVPYSFHLTADPQTKTVRIDAEAGEQATGTMKGYAVATLRLDADEYQTRVSWTIRYFGPPAPEKDQD